MSTKKKDLLGEFAGSRSSDSGRLLETLNLVKTGALTKPLVFDPKPYGDALLKARADAVWEETKPKPVDWEAPTEKLLPALKTNVAEFEARCMRFRAYVAKTKKRLQRAKNPEQLDAAKAELATLQEQLDKMEAELEGYRNGVEHAQQLADAPAVTNDIGIVVGHIVYPTIDRGNIPIFPVIECWFSQPIDLTRINYTSLQLSTVDRRYKVFELGHEDAPIAECDDPVEQSAHDTFQRLRKHWGGWYLRIHSATGHIDFQVYDGNGAREGVTTKLREPIEGWLGWMNITADQARAAVVDASGDLAVAKKMFSCFAKLVGPLPVERAGHHAKSAPEGKLYALIVQDRQAQSTQWVLLDRASFVSQVQKIVGGEFHNVAYESVRPGVNFAHFFGVKRAGAEVWVRELGTTDSQTPAPGAQARFTAQGDRDFWLGDEDRLRETLSKMKRVQSNESFDVNTVGTLVDDDVPSVEKFYTKPGAIKQPTVDAAAPRATEVDKDMHEAIIANFMQVCQVVQVAASGGDANSQKIWPYLRDAVIFEMPPAAYLMLYSEFFRYIVRITKLDPNLALTDHTPKQIKRVLGVMETGADAPFPEKMPFRACFFAYGGGVVDPASPLLATELERVTNRVQSVGKLHGHLVTNTGMVVGFRYVTDAARGQKGIALTFDRDPDVSPKWDRTATLAPWIINALVEYVNEHKTLVEQGKNGLGHQILVKKTAKTLNIKPPVPPPFYVVYMKDSLIREQAQQRATSIKQHINWQHRWKVRGHDCIRYMRGALPLEPELEQELLERGYKIFTTTQPESDLFMALAKRNVLPKQVHEWMAILHYWREASEKGPPDKPMIESTRRSTKKWNRFVDWNAIEVKADS